LAINTYEIGDLVRIRGLFTIDNKATDPTTVVGKFKDPSGTTTTYTYGTDAELVRDGTGNYYFDIDVDEAGVWNYRMAGEGTAQAAAEGKFFVSSTSF
jgi:secreted protein with Ig-like and vWFA domain